VKYTLEHLTPKYLKLAARAVNVCGGQVGRPYATPRNVVEFAPSYVVKCLRRAFEDGAPTGDVLACLIRMGAARPVHMSASKAAVRRMILSGK
jgi:hypothetical protein